MLPLTRSLQGSLWAIQGAGLLPPEVHQVAQFQASCALLLNYRNEKDACVAFPAPSPLSQLEVLPPTHTRPLQRANLRLGDRLEKSKAQGVQEQDCTSKLS